MFYDPEKDLAEQLVAMLEKPQELAGISTAAREWVKRKHTHEAHFADVVETTAAAGRAE